MTGDQPQAIDALAEGILRGDRYQTLLGVTGSGKTFTMANVHRRRCSKPTLVIAHNKTLAAQLCNEFREFLPDNAVEYFVSYYDYYQPEAYVPARDIYIEKDSSINDEIDRLRHAATSALFLRRDVVIVASVSCIYDLGSPEEYLDSVVLAAGRRGGRARPPAAAPGRHPVRAQRLRARARQVPRARRLVRALAGRRGRGAARGALGRRDRGDRPLRPVTGEVTERLKYVAIYPATHFVTQRTGHRARPGRDPARAGRALRLVRVAGQAARGPAPASAHPVRPGDDARDGLLQRHRELLAHPRRQGAGVDRPAACSTTSPTTSSASSTSRT